ncbi:MAG: hypothetical protein ACOC0B_03150 [bacterium]
METGETGDGARETGDGANNPVRGNQGRSTQPGAMTEQLLSANA